jgi:hypothetical protein
MTMNSEVVFLFMYDTGCIFEEEQLNGLLKNQEDFSKYEYTKPGPEEIATFNVPTIFNLKDETLAADNASYVFKVQVSVYKFGGFAIRLRYAFTGGYELLSKVTFDRKVKEFVASTVAKTKRKVMASLGRISQAKESGMNETYRFYYIEGDKQGVMKGHRKLIAGLLIDEPDEATLEDSYVDSLMAKNIAYDSSNVLFVGWESAVMVDKEYVHEHELLMAEIANLELLETRIHHGILTERLRVANRQLESKAVRVSSFMGVKSMRLLEESLGRVYDNSRTILNNVDDTAYGFGEWYLSRVYSLLAEVFKLGAMREMLKSDMAAVDNERKFIDDVITARHENFLEYIVILLIVIEVLVEFIYFAK